MAAPILNRNRLTHGCRTLVHGRLPKGASYVEKITRKLLIQIEAEVVRVRGTISLTDASTINAIVRWERHCQLMQLWLRKGKDLTPDQCMKYSREICLATEKRDAAIRRLDIGQALASRSPWTAPPASVPVPLASPVLTVDPSEFEPDPTPAATPPASPAGTPARRPADSSPDASARQSDPDVIPAAPRPVEGQGEARVIVTSGGSAGADPLAAWTDAARPAGTTEKGNEP